MSSHYFVVQGCSASCFGEFYSNQGHDKFTVGYFTYKDSFSQKLNTIPKVVLKEKNILTNISEQHYLFIYFYSNMLLNTCSICLLANIMVVLQWLKMIRYINSIPSSCLKHSATFFCHCFLHLYNQNALKKTNYLKSKQDKLLWNFLWSYSVNVAYF